MHSPQSKAVDVPTARPQHGNLFLLSVESPYTKPAGKWTPLAYMGTRDMSPGQAFYSAAGESPSTVGGDKRRLEQKHPELLPVQSGFFVPAGKCLWGDPDHFRFIADILHPENDPDRILVQPD